MDTSTQQDALALAARPTRKRFMDSFVPKKPKSGGWAVVLTLFFGPFGALYIGWKYAGVMAATLISVLATQFIIQTLYVQSVTIVTVYDYDNALATLDTMTAVFRVAWFSAIAFYVAYAMVLAQRSQETK